MNFKTGDMMFVSGHGYFANIIKQVMGVQWSHLALQVHEDGKDLVWESTGKGVGEVPWLNYISKEDFLTRLTNPGAGDVYVRRLIWPDVITKLQCLERFRGHRNLVRGRPYEQNRLQMYCAAFPNLAPFILGQAVKTLDLTSIFCWECAASAWRDMGLLPQEIAPHTYPITWFMQETVPLLLNVQLGPMEKIA